MNTVGKPGRLGEDIRCVVSVSMLTEGWDANTVTHILGVRAFGTQLLCEQVVGRALRRQSYHPNREGRFDPEYADVLGVPFDFTAKPTVVPPTKPQRTEHVHAVVPERDRLERDLHGVLPEAGITRFDTCLRYTGPVAQYNLVHGKESRDNPPGPDRPGVVADDSPRRKLQERFHLGPMAGRSEVSTLRIGSYL